MSQKPVALAMIVCDSVIDDRRTNKKSLIGIFNNITSKSFPCRHNQLNVYLSLTDGRGTVKGILRCVRKDTDNKLMELNGEIPFPDGNATVEFNFEINGIVFPEPGIYSFDFLCNGEPVVTKDITVQQK